MWLKYYALSRVCQFYNSSKGLFAYDFVFCLVNYVPGELKMLVACNRPIASLEIIIIYSILAVF